MAIDMLRLWVWWISWWNRMVGIPVMIWSLMMIHVERRRSNIRSVQILHYIISLYMNRIVHVKDCGTPWPTAWMIRTIDPKVDPWSTHEDLDPSGVGPIWALIQFL